MENNAGWTIARLDFAHDEIHTHYYGFEANDDPAERERARKVLAVLPSDPETAAYVINSQWSTCYDIMLQVAEGRRP